MSNQVIALVKSAAKAKAPIVAIPDEGRTPVCIRAKLLKGALKNVTIVSAEVVKLPDLETFKKPEPQYVYELRKMVPVEGPAERIVTPGERRLKITGKDGRVRTSCSIIPVPRRVAMHILSKWTEKEREKQSKKILLGDTAKALPKRAKSYEYALDGDEAVTITLRKPDKSTFQSKGIVILLDSMPGYEFVLHSANGEYQVSERSSGILAATGKNTTEAVANAEMNFRKYGVDGAKQKIADNQLESAAA